MERIDLHVHTLASDGSDAPETVVRKAAAAGLRAVAITDHDTFAGLPEALAAGTACGIEVVPGVAEKEIGKDLTVSTLIAQNISVTCHKQKTAYS